MDNKNLRKTAKMPKSNSPLWQAMQVMFKDFFEQHPGKAAIDLSLTDVLADLEATTGIRYNTGDVLHILKMHYTQREDRFEFKRTDFIKP